MAKLKAPLMSLGAAGQLGKTLVFFPWKGLNVVREYVVPSNPNTALQQAQRAHVTTLVAAIHAKQAAAVDPLGEADQIAYSALAQVKGKIMTWFNMAVKLGIDCLVAAKGYTVYANGTTVDADTDDIDLYVGIQDDGVTQVADGKFYFGSSKTNLIHSKVAILVAGVNAHLTNSDCSAFMVVGTKYYWQFRPDAGDPCVGADSGIYHFVAE